MELRLLKQIFYVQHLLNILLSQILLQIHILSLMSTDWGICHSFLIKLFGLIFTERWCYIFCLSCYSLDDSNKLMLLFKNLSLYVILRFLQRLDIFSKLHAFKKHLSYCLRIRPLSLFQNWPSFGHLVENLLRFVLRYKTNLRLIPHVLKTLNRNSSNHYGLCVTLTLLTSYNETCLFILSRRIVLIPNSINP